MANASEPQRCTLSVVVPCLDEEQSLPALLTSLAAAGHAAPDEVLIVDGGSEDATCELARAAGATVHVSERGRGRQLALGASRSSGELLLFLHADSHLEQGALEHIRAAFHDASLAYAGLKQCIEHPGRFYRWIEAAADARVRRGMVYGDSGLCVRRSAYDSAGGFAPQDLFEDYDLSRRLRAQGSWTWIESAELVISARRWQREGILRRTLKNKLLTLAFRSGIDPARLVRYYAREPKSAKSP